MSYVFELIEREEKRQNETIELIASENFVSDNVRKAVGSVLTNKYTEGYPKIRPVGKNGNKGRYYGGCDIYDELEEYCALMWQKVFHTDYHVNVQPHSGSSANMEAYDAFLEPGDTILAMSLDAGGHLTHSSPVSFVSKRYNVVAYDVDENGWLDYDKIATLAYEYQPKMIVCGASSYSRTIDFEEFKRIADNVGAYLMADISHIAGLIAADQHPSPFGLADVITTTVHKTLRGPRGALIFCKPEYAKKVDSAVFPRNQGGALQHVIAGKAVAAEEAYNQEFVWYIQQVIRNAKAMADEFQKLGYKIVSGGTDNHMFLLDLTGHNVTGLQVQEKCDDWGITLNKNAIPNDPLGPKLASGVRIGTPAMTTKGWDEKKFRQCAHTIDMIIKLCEEENK